MYREMTPVICTKINHYQRLIANPAKCTGDQAGAAHGLRDASAKAGKMPQITKWGAKI